MNRPTTPGPLDLDLLLRSVADEVTPRANDATSAGLVRDGVRHARRRRALLVGAATALVVGAVGVGASAVLADDPRPVLPAPAPTSTPYPAPTHRAAFPSPVTTDALRCGAPAPAATDAHLLATASVDPAEVSVRSPEVAEVAGRVSVDGAARVSVLDPAATAGYVVVHDGVVVASAQPAHDGTRTISLTPAETLGTAVAVDPAHACAPDGGGGTAALAPGEYGLAMVVPWVVSSYALERDGTPGAPVTSPASGAPLFDGWLVSPTVPFTVAAAPEEEVTEPPAAPDPVPGAFAGPTTAFPAAPSYEDLQCGMPAPTPTGDELLARLETPEALSVTTGTESTLPVRLVGLSTARTETVDFRWVRAYVVSRDGVIVTSTAPATDAESYTVLAPGATESLDHAVASTVACEWGLPSEDRLPPGEYTLQAVHPWMITSYALQQRDGSWGAENAGGDLYKGWLVSDPVRLTIT
ncbi:hypothetical protein [Cellulosimicrobium sp. NPDC057862]|uniref:hypothetical protein n=1 Tax=Cellulosimicrobium sp. NPDC057862 TaxID=3346266 RepID=UPI0036726190